jgi:hypothetical protein
MKVVAVCERRNKKEEKAISSMSLLGGFRHSRFCAGTARHNRCFVRWRP